MKADSPFLFPVFAMRLLIALLFLAGCVDATEDNLTGKLVRVEVVTVSDGCSPARFSGDAGLQFFGVRDDGGVAFTMGQNAQYGPAPDGGVVQSVAQQLLPPANGGRAVVGNEAGCDGLFSNWALTDAGLDLAQDLPGVDTCPSGPVWLPLKACSSSRSYLFTEVGTCELRCVRISTSGEIECRC